MHETNVSNKEALQQNTEHYRQGVAFLNNLDGFQKFIKARLKSFNLNGQYSPDDIVNECFLRWHKAVEDGKEIPVLDGWMRKTAFNVIRELSRRNRKVDLREPTDLAESLPDAQEEADGDDEQHQTVHQALKQLSQEKQELLEFRFFQNLSWDDITDVYASRGQKNTSQTLRKRGQRAMDELRKIYLSILENK
jgi:RNA polymerase sigma factor (sigma-70 family)